jgi:glutaminase
MGDFLGSLRVRAVPGTSLVKVGWALTGVAVAAPLGGPLGCGRKFGRTTMTKPDQSPFKDYLSDLHAKLKGVEEGEVASYIPELAKAAPESFGISFATIDGRVYSVGDSQTAFSIQSVSKPFAYGGALQRLSQAGVLSKVGVEPTGEAFNSIVLDEERNRAFNPMVNAGAIAIAALSEGETPAARVEAMVTLFSEFAGRRLEIDDAVYRSEAETGHRNRAIAYLMLNSGIIEREPEEVLDLYFRQCSLMVTTEDLAIMGAVLANNGVHPVTGRRLLGPEQVRDVLTLMMSCGMYDYAGEWSFDVGLAAKSGVSGGVLAVLPGQLSLAIWSPPLDKIGNSVRGIEACRRISQDFGLHMFYNAAAVENVVRRETRADSQPSLRIRNPRDRDILEAEGHRIAMVELQGALYFASTERMLSHLERLVTEVDFVILDFRRLNSIDTAAKRFFEQFLQSPQTKGTEIAFAEVEPGDPETVKQLQEIAANNSVRIFASLDSALETFEDIILEKEREPFDYTRFSLDSIGVFNGLEPDELSVLEQMVQPMHFDAGDKVLSKGDAGEMLFVLARGSVSVMVPVGDDNATRVSCIGPGQFFGEMAVLEEGPRSADVVADERIVCYGLTAAQIRELSQSHPRIVSVLMTNMAREFALRIRKSNMLISSLQ